MVLRACSREHVIILIIIAVIGATLLTNILVDYVSGHQSVNRSVSGMALPEESIGI
jgi:hypothetical protein